MSNYNHARFLTEALEAIVGQSRKPDEFLIIDDASTDNSVEIIEQYAKKYSFIRFFQNKKNVGPVVNARRLMDMCTSDYVYGAAADDKILPGFFEKSMDLLEKHREAALCIALSYLTNENGKIVGRGSIGKLSKSPCFLPPDKCLEKLRKYESWTSSGNMCIYKKNTLMETGGFIPELGAYADGFIRKVLALKYGTCFIPEYLGEWRRMESGYSASASSNISKSLATAKYADTLMRTRYVDLFPEDLATQTTNLYLYWILADAWSKNKSHENIVSIIKAFSNVSVFDNFLKYLPNPLGKCYIALRLKLLRAIVLYAIRKIIR
ncbi:glycosyltransferase [bacterium]|nr:glycosyltransferase [bacterium]